MQRGMTRQFRGNKGQGGMVSETVICNNKYVERSVVYVLFT